VVTSQVIGDPSQGCADNRPAQPLQLRAPVYTGPVSVPLALCHDYAVMETTQDLQPVADHARPNKRRHLAAGERQRAVRA
jgi:hypothetical protein